MSSFEPLVFSGVQPTGNLTLGNYLGAIRKFVALQETHDCIYCVVDLHALTVNPKPQELIDGTRSIAAAFLAAGLVAVSMVIYFGLAIATGAIDRSMLQRSMTRRTAQGSES